VRNLDSIISCFSTGIIDGSASSVGSLNSANDNITYSKSKYRYLELQEEYHSTSCYCMVCEFSNNDMEYGFPTARCYTVLKAVSGVAGVGISTLYMRHYLTAMLSNGFLAKLISILALPPLTPETTKLLSF
jgi:hypothetical protein